MEYNKRLEFAKTINEFNFDWVDSPIINGFQFENKDFDENCWYLCLVLNKVIFNIFWEVIYSSNLQQLIDDCRLDTNIHIVLCWYKLENPTSIYYCNQIKLEYNDLLNLYKNKFIMIEEKAKQKRILELETELKQLKNSL